MSHQEFIYIDGAWCKPQGGRPLEVIDPATEQPVGRILLGSEADVDAAVKAARNAFDSWSRTSPLQRAELLDKIVAEYDKRIGEIAETITLEMGSPLSFSQNTQTVMARERFTRAAKIAREFAFQEQVGSSLVVREPIGVCAFITPWNWPLAQAASKIAYGLAAGCTVIWKPSELSPLSAVLLVEAIHAAGLPEGVFNFVQGDGPTVGAALASHPDIDMISFTGSTRAGISVAKAAADTVKRVHQELGGKSAHIVLQSADLKEAVKNTVQMCFRNSGQSCQAPTRLLVQRDRMAEAANFAREAAEAMKTGNPREQGTDMGPLVNQAQWQRVQKMIQSGIDEGATLVCGGLGKPQNLETGHYVQPTIFMNVTPDMTIAREEIFGPVLSILAYDDEDDAIGIANGTVFGLAAYLSGNDREELLRVAPRLRAGRVYFNFAPAAGDVPFGGYKQSGNGREQGVHGLEDFTELKAILGYGAA